MAALLSAALGVTLATGGALAVGVAPAPAVTGAVWLAATALLALASGIRALELRTRTRRAFLVGTESQHRDLVREAARCPDVAVVGFSAIASASADPDRLRARIERSSATVLLLADEAIRDPRLVALARRVNLEGMRVRDLRGFYEREFEKVAVSELSPAWFLFDIAEIHRRRVYGTAKRVIESAVAAAVLLACSPLLPVLALGIRLSSPGPVLFSQERVGRHGRRFRLTKFRTMHAAPAGQQAVWAGACENRIFPLGRLLRRFRLDELPQLVAVIRGDLSLVGPRPEQPDIAADLERSIPHYGGRHAVRPGLTGWAQVNLGYGGSAEGTLTKLQYDLYYVKRQSILLDLRVIAATARTMLMGIGR